MRLSQPRPKARIVDERTGERDKKWALLRRDSWREYDRQTRGINLLTQDFRFAIYNTLVRKR